MNEFKPLDRSHDNAPAFEQTNDWPPGFYYTHSTINIVNVAGRNISGGGSSYALPTSRYDDPNIGTPTVICYVGPSDKPAILYSGRDLELTGVQIQCGDFRRDANNNPIMPAREGVGIEFRRNPNKAPGGRCLFGSVSFVGWGQAIRLADESNHIVMQFPKWEYCQTCLRSEHDQNYGVHIVHGWLGPGCELFADMDRGGMWTVDYLYTNSPITLARFNNISANRSWMEVNTFVPDHNAKGWKLVEAVHKGAFHLKVGGHVTKGGAPADDWMKLNGSAESCVDISELRDPYGVCPE